MDYAPSNRNSASTKIVVAGGFGVGKTTFVGAVSEIDPLRTEALVTQESEGQDDISKVQSKHTTTVAMDFGRITLAENLVLYLFGTPGQRRFWFMWDDLVRGAIGAIVLVDCRRLQDSFPAVDFFENRKLPFLIAVAGAAVFSLCTVASAIVLRWVIDHVVNPRLRDGHVAAGTVVTGLALVIGFGGWHREVNGQLFAWLQLLPLALIALSFWAFRGPRALHWLQLLNVPATLWLALIDSMLVSGKWL